MSGNPELFLSRTGYRQVSAGTSAILSPGADINGVLFTGASNIIVPPLEWSQVIGPTNMVINHGYVANNSSQVLLNLPVTAVFGAIIRIAGKGAGGWKITQNSGQTIHFGDDNTTAGVSGFISSQNSNDCLELLCTTDNTDFTVLSCVGNMTVV